MWYYFSKIFYLSDIDRWLFLHSFLIAINIQIWIQMAYKDVPLTKQSLPSRGIGNPPQQWTRQKTLRDQQLWGNSQQLWIMENKLYDLSPFIHLHPGGSHWLTMTKGQDITQHFITHHLREDKARSVLQKYYVKQVTVKQEPRFTFQENGLYRKVKSSLLQKYPPEQLQDCSKSVLDGSLFIALWVATFLFMAYYRSYLLAMLCGLLIYPIVGVAHNFIHMKNHPFRFLWLFTGFTHQQWQQMHCLSHHAYANTLIDFQIQALEPIIFYLRVSPRNKTPKWIAKEIALMLLIPMNILIKLLVQPVIKRIKPQWQYVVPLLQLPILMALTQDVGTSVKLFLTIHIFFSFIFSKLTFLGHRTGFEWTEGNSQIRDFGEHQVYASSDTPTNNCKGFLSYLLYAGFNYHAVHHFFPTIDNHYLPVANAILQAEAEKKGVKLNLHKGVLSALFQIQKNFFSRKQWKKVI